MLKITKENLIYLQNLLMVNFTIVDNIDKIFNIYHENYGFALSNEDINSIINSDISILSNFDNYVFIEKSSWLKEDIFNICVERKKIYIGEWLDNFNGYVLTYHDDIRLWEKFRDLDIYDNSGNLLTLNQKIVLIWHIGKFIQTNFFLQMFRSLYINDYGVIINLFNLRFYNEHEIINMANDWDLRWSKIINESGELTPFFMEKVDWQMLMLFTYDNVTFLQSKGAVTTIDLIDFDKNWIFGSVVKLIWTDWLLYLQKMSQENNDIVYHFELLATVNQVVQEYSEPWLFLIGWRYINSFRNCIDFSNEETFMNTYYWIYDWKYITKIVFSSDENIIYDKIKKTRAIDDDYDNYVIEWYVMVKWYLFTKIKNYQYFIAKLIKSFSLSKSKETINGIKNVLQKDANFLTIQTNFLMDSENIYDSNLINESLDKVSTLKQNRKLKISYTRFIRYLAKHISRDLVDDIIFSIKNNKNKFIEIYKDFLIESLIDVIAWMLTSDQEEISALHNILGVGGELDISSDNLKSDVKNIIYEKLNFDENSYFINKVKIVINDIKSI